MCLGADAVDGDAISDEALHESNDGIDFRASVVEVVVVDEELCCGVGLLRSAEGDVDEFGAEQVVENRSPPCAVVVKDLVDYVPVVNLASVPAGDVGDVALDDRGQLGGIGDRGNPCVVLVGFGAVGWGTYTLGAGCAKLGCVHGPTFHAFGPSRPGSRHHSL